VLYIERQRKPSFHVERGKMTGIVNCSSPTPLEGPCPGRGVRERVRKRNSERKTERKSWARLISRVYLEDPSLCSSCQKPMGIISALTSPHQDEAIEKILRHREQWHPP
jgi:hypothetical protein